MGEWGISFSVASNVFRPISGGGGGRREWVSTGSHGTAGSTTNMIWLTIRERERCRQQIVVLDCRKYSFQYILEVMVEYFADFDNARHHKIQRDFF